MRVAPYGSWKSPITLDMVAHGTVDLVRIVLDGPDTYWSEVRPAEDGRTVIVRRSPDGEMEDITPSDFSAVSLVNEYGTRSFTAANRVVYFSNDSDQRVYRQRPGEEPFPITPEGDSGTAARSGTSGSGRSSAYGKITPTRMKTTRSAKS